MANKTPKTERPETETKQPRGKSREELRRAVTRISSNIRAGELCEDQDT